jgi:hypothetical protein
MHESVRFASTCPKCQVQQPQQGFSRAALRRLFNGGWPIEAYCEGCDEFWVISPKERVVLAFGLRSDNECGAADSCDDLVLREGRLGR